MFGRIERLLKLRPGEWKLVLPMLLLLAINTMVVELTAVVATSGFVSNVGAKQLPWLWIVDMLALVVFGGIYSLVVDRTRRTQLISWLLGGFAFIYLLIQLLFSYGAPDSLNYFLLYILADQQFFIFPLAFWALANDVYRIAESKRLFPVIGAGYALGSVMGNTVAASSASIFATYGGEAYQLLTLAAVMLIIAFLLLHFSFRNQKIQARQSKEETFNMRESLRVGTDFFKNVPLFRYLGLIILLVYIAYTIVQYNFLFTLDQAFASDLQFQTFYGVYKAGLVIATLLFQWLVTSRLLEKMEIKSSFIIFPTTLLVAAAAMLLSPGLMAATAGIFMVIVIELAWDEPARKSLQGLIPDERRGRVSIFLDSYMLAASTISACFILLLLFWISTVALLPAQTVTLIYLTIASLAAAGAIWAAIRARQEYDQSMLNWRLSRRQRRGFTGVMQKLDF